MFLSTRMFIEDNSALIQKTNADTAANLSTQIRESLEAINDKARILTTILSQHPQSSAASASRTRVIQEFFAKDKDFLAVFVIENYGQPGASVRVFDQAVAPELGRMGDGDGQLLLKAITSTPDRDVEVSTATLADGTPATLIGFPLGAGTIALSVTRQNRFVRVFSESDIVTSYMVDRKGRALAHPDAARVAAGESVAHLAIVKQMLEGKFNNGQTRYIDPQSREPRIGAFRTVGFGGLGVITEVAEAKAFEAAKRVEYRLAGGAHSSVSQLLGGLSLFRHDYLAH